MFLLVACIGGCLAAVAPAPTVGGADDAAAQIESPVLIQVRLKPNQVAAARDGRLGLVERAGKALPQTVARLQWDPADTGLDRRGVCLLPPGAAGQLQFAERPRKEPFARVMQATRDLATGQIEITDSGKPVLRARV